jgi:hypothetical protein
MRHGRRIIIIDEDVVVAVEFGFSRARETPNTDTIDACHLMYFYTSCTSSIIQPSTFFHIAFMICGRLRFLRNKAISQYCKLSARSRAKTVEFRHYCRGVFPYLAIPCPRRLLHPAFNEKTTIWDLGELIPPAFLFARWWYKPTPVFQTPHTWFSVPPAVFRYLRMARR